MYSLSLDIYQEGQAKEKAAMVDRMIKYGLPDEQIMRLSEVDADYVLAHRQALAQQKQDERALQKA